MRPGDLLMLAAIFAIMYFLLIRPQQKKMKEHQQMIENIRRGDQVIELEVEIADNVKVRVIKGTVAQVLNKTEPAKA